MFGHCAEDLPQSGWELISDSERVGLAYLSDRCARYLLSCEFDPPDIPLANTHDVTCLSISIDRPTNSLVASCG